MSLLTVSKIQKESGSTNIDVPSTGQFIDLASAAQGDVLYHNGTSYVRLAPGTSGQVLQTQGAGANPVWAADASGLVQKVYETNLNTTVTTTSGSYVASGLTITTDAPASTSSRFLLTLLGGQQLGTVNYDHLDTTFYVGGVEVADTGPYEQYMYHISTQKDAHAAQMIHSPASVSAQTYAVFYKRLSGSGTVSFNVSAVRVVFTVMEIGA